LELLALLGLWPLLQFGLGVSQEAWTSMIEEKMQEKRSDG